MIFRYSEFLKEDGGIILNYYCFDWDDNLLKMPTKINMEKNINGEWVPISISTEQFSEVRSDKSNWRPGKDAFIEFTDNGPRGESGFLSDTIDAVGGSKYPDPPKKIAPSWFKFIECLISGSIFAIITARGCSPETIRNSIEWILDNYLSHEEKKKMYNNCLSYYYLFKRPGKFTPNFDRISKHPMISEWLDNCGYYGVSHPDFVNKNKSGGAESPEIGKEIAIREFIERGARFANEIGATFKAGMSDDDVKNVMHMRSVLSDLQKIYPESELTVFDTSKGGYIKTDVKESSTQATGMESSIIPFSQFGGIQSKLFPSNDMGNDPSSVSHNLAVDHINKKINPKLRRKYRRGTPQVKLNKRLS